MEPVFVDEHLKLVPVSRIYSREIFENFTQEIIRYLLVEKPPVYISETEAFIDQSVEQMKNGTDIIWVILNDSEFTGCCGIHNIPSRQPHFGLWLKAGAQGKGHGSKIVRFGLNWAVQNLDIDYVRYPVDIHNSASISIIEKVTRTVHASYTMGENKRLEVNEYRIYANDPGSTYS